MVPWSRTVAGGPALPEACFCEKSRTEQAHAIGLPDVRLLSCHSAELHSCNRDALACIATLPFTEKVYQA